MKIYKNILFLFLVASATIWGLTSCQKETVGTPTISYVRVTTPESADSLLVSAGQGQLIAIVGDNLQDAREIWFNDQQARVTPSYISKNSILVRLPSEIPVEINNQIRIIFGNGYELLHDFVVDISEPRIDRMKSEFVNAGDVAVIYGDFFYEPLTVTFAGGATGEIVSVEATEIHVRVPDNAQAGQITVSTNFGSDESNFMFRDPRNHFINSDPYEGWWNSGYVVSDPGPDDPPKISGNYIRFTKQVGAWSWNEVAGGPATSMPTHSKNIPDEAILNPDAYNLKFEVNTLKPYNGNVLKINVGLSAEDNNGYKWNPPYDTNGEWQTVTIPLTEVFAEYNPKPTVNPNGYWTRILIGHGPGTLDADLAFDNFRVVPKEIK